MAIQYQQQWVEQIRAESQWANQQQGCLLWCIGCAYLSARLLYSSFYILNLPILRSLMFGVGSASIAVLMISSLMLLS
ncbi:MAPEG family protein [Leptolyngbya sp. 7M]|nr:MAPEG family protein [Leptolyngbya sp. 7M]